jgi:hypothetical protein
LNKKKDREEKGQYEKPARRQQQIKLPRKGKGNENHKKGNYIFNIVFGIFLCSRNETNNDDF